MVKRAGSKVSAKLAGESGTPCAANQRVRRLHVQAHFQHRAHDRTHRVLDAAITGMGIALESDRMAWQALQRGDLVPVFADRKGMPVHAHHPVYPRSHGQWSRVARFTQWLRVEIAAEV